MINKKISKTTFQAHLIDFVRDEMYEEAIKDDGIYSTFKLHNRCFTTITLQYYKFDGDGCSWMPMQKKIFYRTCPELGNATLPYISPEALQKATDRIKMDAVKTDDAIWSTIEVKPCHNHFDVRYQRVYVSDMTIKWKPEFDEYVASDVKATTEAFMIENTKQTMERLRENTYYGLCPARHSGSTYAFDKKAKEDLKASLNKIYGLSKTKEKEKKDMNVTLMVVPEGINNEFVRKVKARFQSNNSLRLFIASTDIDFSCPYGTTRTKYDLFEDWVKRGKVDIVYFMLGFEKDPDVRAFEAFVRGITENGAPGKDDVRVAYQRDEVLNDANNLRTAYFDEADAKEDLENAGNKVVKEAKTMQDIYGLDDEGLEAIKYSKGRIEVSEGLIMDKIMDAAFAEEVNPKKGGKK